jgi:hypothetical protein
VFAKVEALKGQGRPVAELDAAVKASGMTPDAYKARVAQVRANAGNPVYAAVSGVADAATFGFADELGGFVDAAKGHLAGDDKRPFGEAVREATANRRAEQVAARQAHPWLHGGGEVAGGVMSAPLMPGVGVGGTIARAAEQGAVGGAAYGLGSGDDGLLSRLKGAGRGLVTGGVAGGVLGTAGRAIGAALGRGAGPKIVDATGNLTREASDMLRGQGLDPNAVDVPLARQAALELAGGGTGRARQADPVSVAATVRRLIGERHGVGLTTPEATRDIGQIAKVQEALAGTRGAPAMHEAQAASVAGQEAVRAGGRQPGAAGGARGRGRLRRERHRRPAGGGREQESRRRVAGRAAALRPDRHRPAHGDGGRDRGPVPDDPGEARRREALRHHRGRARLHERDADAARSVVDNNVSFADADEIRKVLGQLSRNAADKTDRYKIDTTIKGSTTGSTASPTRGPARCRRTASRRCGRRGRAPRTGSRRSSATRATRATRPARRSSRYARAISTIRSSLTS